MIKVLVNGALGKMGSETVKAVTKADNLQLVCAVDVNAPTKSSEDTPFLGNLQVGLSEFKPDVVVDFTRPDVVMNNLREILKHGVYAVVGTTGFSDADLAELDELAKANNTAVLIAPNFSIGAILLMKYSTEIIKYMPRAEIIELHHDQKLDAPSGTAMLTAKKMAKARGEYKNPNPVDEKELLTGARGANYEDIHVHSVRLPGYVAHQEVIFGALGETLTLRHDSISRECFMPGVVMACRKIQNYKGLIYGLDKMM